MKVRLSFFLVFLALSSALQYVRVYQLETKASNEMHVRNLDTGLSYTRIQDAIDAPETLNGHTIFVEEGTYHENLHMNKSLSLIGENREKTVVDGNGSAISDYVLLIDHTSNVVVKGFTFQNCHIGAFLLYCNFSRISGNRMRDCSWFGVWVYYSSNNFIDGNVLETNNVGIFLSASPHLAANNILFGNAFCNNLQAGIRVYWVSNNSIWANWIDGSPKGIELFKGDENSIEANTFQDNEAGTYLTESNDNMFFHNNYINNTENVVVDKSIWDLSTDNWDNSYPLGGNYWSNHNGTDLFSGPYQNKTGRDGIADTSYVIDEDNEDNHPLMTPFVSQSMSIGLLERDFQLQTDYADLSSAYDRLLWNFTQLQTNYENLHEASDNLSAMHKATLDELDHLRNLAYALTVMTTILAGAATVLAIVVYRRRHTVVE